MTQWVPPAPPGNGHVTGPCDDVTGHVIARTEFSLSLMCPPTPRSACVLGGRGLHGPRHMSRPGRHLYKGGLGTRGPSLLTHTTSYAGNRAFMRRWVRIALNNRLFAWSIVTRRRGVGGEIPPWGKGLKGLKHELFKLYFFHEMICTPIGPNLHQKVVSILVANSQRYL